MMASEKLRPEDIDSAIAATTPQGARGGRPEDQVERDLDLDLDREPQQGDWLDDRDDEAEIPDYPEDGLRAGDEPAAMRSEPAAPRRMMPVIAGGIGLLVVAALVWWVFRPSTPSVEDIPVIAAETGEVKTKPVDEGGMDVPNQDITVYDQIANHDTSGEPQVVLPQPESPITPEPQAAGAAPAGGAGNESVVDAVLAEMKASGAAAPAAPAVPAIPGIAAVPAAPAGSATSPAADGDATQTASLPATPAAPAPASETASTAPAEGSGMRVQLASFKSQDQARDASAKLQHDLAELAGQAMHIERADLGARGIYYRIQAGPLGSRDEAAALCTRLKQRGQACILVAP
jgi:cell division septation protein DedD